MPEGREPKATAYDKSRPLYFKYNQRQELPEKLAKHRQPLTKGIGMTAQLLDLLSESEIKALTGYERADKQAKVLQEHGIFYVQRRDGTLAVTLHAVHNPAPYKPKPKESRINLEAAK